jgi:hypothetical protein
MVILAIQSGNDAAYFALLSYQEWDKSLGTDEALAKNYASTSR